MNPNDIIHKMLYHSCSIPIDDDGKMLEGELILNKDNVWETIYPSNHWKKFEIDLHCASAVIVARCIKEGDVNGEGREYEIKSFKIGPAIS